MVKKSSQHPIHNYNLYESFDQMLPSHSVEHLHEKWKERMISKQDNAMKNKNMNGTSTKPFIKEKGSGVNIKGIDATPISSIDIIDSSRRDSQNTNSFPSKSSLSSLSNSRSNLCSNPSLNLNSYYDSISFLFEQQELSTRKFGALSRKEIESICQSNSKPRSHGPKIKNMKKVKLDSSRSTVKGLDYSSIVEHVVSTVSSGNKKNIKQTKNNSSREIKKNADKARGTSSRRKNVHSFTAEELTILADERLKRMITKKVKRVLENALKKFEMPLRIKTSESNMGEIELELF